MPLIIGVSCSDTTTPMTTPHRLPNSPASRPYQTKMARIRPSFAPRVRRTAMSPLLSFTAITRVETMLKQATPITSTIARYMMARIIWISRYI
ncbi:hypothetical protein D3C76_1323330 [compost metagenome]